MNTSLSSPNIASKNWFAFIAALLTGLLILISGCTPLGPVTTKYFDITDFNAVEISSVFDVEILPAQTYSVAITTNDNFMSYIQVSKSGKTLKIATQGVTIHLGSKFKARVTMPELVGLKISGASRSTVRGFRTAYDFDVELSGASRLDMDMETNQFKADISGASSMKGRLVAGNSDIHGSGAVRIELVGSAENTTIELSGASSAPMPEFAVEDASVIFSGGSRGSFIVNGQLDVNLSGGSRLDYGGNPALRNVDISGGSSLRPR